MSFRTFVGGVVGKTFDLDRHEARSRRTRSHLKTAATLASLSITVASSAQQVVQWRVEDGGSGHWYRRLAIRLDWPSANSFATANGGHLATLTSAAENSFVLANGADRYDGLGGFAPNGQGCNPSAWAWVTGEPWSFTSWASPEPNYCSETILAFAQNGFPRWNNYFPSAQLNYWVEWSADCNGDGIVDYGQTLSGSLPDYDGDNIPDCCESGTPCTVGNYPVEWRVEEGGNGHWYRRIDTLINWEGARVASESLAGHLVTIGSAAENGRVRLLIASGGWHWSGGRFRCSPSPCSWRWVTDEPWTYQAWLPGEPNSANESERMIMAGTGWLDYLEGTIAAGYVVEWSADCDADGVVDYGQILRGEVADVNGNGIPDTCDCPADINQSGTIDAEDLAYVLFAWGMPGSKAGGADINGDATVDANDLSLVLGSWGPCP